MVIIENDGLGRVWADQCLIKWWAQKSAIVRQVSIRHSSPFTYVNTKRGDPNAIKNCAAAYIFQYPTQCSTTKCICIISNIKSNSCTPQRICFIIRLFFNGQETSIQKWGHLERDRAATLLKNQSLVVDGVTFVQYSLKDNSQTINV